MIAVAPTDDRARLLAVAHERDRGGREVVVDRAELRAQQAVHE
jgi:hypothetical protein